MDDIISVILILGILLVVGIFIFYIFNAYFAPKKLDQLAEMIQAGNLITAIKRLQMLIEENDRNIYAHFLLGNAYQIQKKNSEAIIEYKKILRIGKFDNKVSEQVVRKKLAQLLLEAKNLDDAKKELLILTKLDPTNADNFYQLGLLFKNGGIQDKALYYFKKCTQIQPAHSEAFMHQGILLYSLSHLIEAKQSLVQCIKSGTSIPEAHYYLGLCLKSQKDYDWAIREFDMGMDDPKLKGRSYLGKGLCFMENDNPDRAINEFEAGLQYARKDSDLELSLRYFIASSSERKRDLYMAIQQWEYISNINAHFKDVPQKLKEYEAMRTEDSIKDFMIATPIKFEQISKDIIHSLELKLLDIQVENDSEIRAVASESNGKWRSTKISSRLIYIYRTTDPIPEKTVRSIYENMRNQNFTKGICITTSTFTPQAEIFCQSRPIELVDKIGMIQYLKQI